MRTGSLPPLGGLHIHLVGAKGTGMAALAEILAARGAVLSGSDVGDVFYTDRILAGIGLNPSVGFDAAHVPSGTNLVVHSAAYAPDRNPELQEAARRGIPVLSYPEALGAISAETDSSGIAGVHGKTTTTAMAGTLVEALGLRATVLAGSAVSNFGGHSTIIRGNDHFIAETCEYRRHFLHFRPTRILLTSVESDHQDFFPTRQDIVDAFVEYGCLLPRGGTLIFCADDEGAVETAGRILARRPDIRTIEYGFSARGRFRILRYETGDGESRFRMEGSGETFVLKVPGRHLVLDAAGALALVSEISGDAADWRIMRDALAAFSGSSRRSELVGEAGGILVMDDYGHHPTAIAATIAGIREFHPGRRLVVDFMSHTYSRTAALLREFVASLDGADCVVLHRIYASAREEPVPGLDGRTLFDLLRARRPGLAAADPRVDRFAMYTDNPEESLQPLLESLRPGDLFLTMGAGDNWKLGRALLAALRAREQAR